MATYPRISVIIPTFNRSAYLTEALASIAVQTYPASEVIVVDDCSPEPFEHTEIRTLPVRIVHHARNQGPGAARNTGFSVSSGDWILFMDDDDLLTPTRLQMAVEGMGSSRFHSAGVERFYPDGRTELGPQFCGDLRETLLDGSTPHGGKPAMGQVVIRREDFVQFDPTLRRAEDSEWWHRMRDRALFSCSEEIGLRRRMHYASRDYMKSDYFVARRKLALAYGEESSPRARAHLYRRTAGAALEQGLRLQALHWSFRSLLAEPTQKGVKQMLLAVTIGRKR